MRGAQEGAFWETTVSRLREVEPAFYALEANGALALGLDEEDGWILEITPDGRLICQVGMELDDVKSLMSEGTCEDLGSDEVAKQAKYYLQSAVSKKRNVLLAAGFKESIEMNDQYVATLFQRAVDFAKLDDVIRAIRWCRDQFQRFR